MKKTTLLSLSAALAVCLSASFASATTIADWTFETSQPITAGPLAPEVGAGSATGSHAGASVYSTPAGNGSAHSFSSNLWAVNDNYQFQVLGTGATTYYINWDQNGSGTGPAKFDLQASSDGSSFTTVTSITIPSGVTWNATTANTATQFTGSSFTFGSAPANVYFRLLDTSTTSVSGGAVGTGGTGRVDNVIIADAPIPVVPEPSTLVLAGLGLLGFAARSNRRKNS